MQIFHHLLSVYVQPIQIFLDSYSVLPKTEC